MLISLLLLLSGSYALASLDRSAISTVKSLLYYFKRYYLPLIQA
jgi:hypothetical protein